MVVADPALYVVVPGKGRQGCGRARVRRQPDPREMRIRSAFRLRADQALLRAHVRAAGLRAPEDDGGVAAERLRLIPIAEAGGAGRALVSLPACGMSANRGRSMRASVEA